MNYDALIYSAESREMLNSHIEFLARVSIKASTKLLQEYFIGIENIKRNPYGYPYLGERKQRYHKYLFCKRYLIIYLVEKETIYIDYIVDVRQNYFTNILKS